MFVAACGQFADSGIVVCVEHASRLAAPEGSANG